MTDTTQPRRVTIEKEGRLLAQADLQSCDPPGTIQAAVHVESGHVAPGMRSRLVDEVLDSQEVREAERVKAVVPRGDAEVIQRMQDRLEQVSTRSAGASVVMEGVAPKKLPH